MALLLYALLVVLPGAVFGGLLWRQLDQDQSRQMQEVPAAVEDGAARFSQAMAARIRAILMEEEGRSPLDFLRYDQSFDSSGLMISKQSVLHREERRDGVLGWFAQDPGAPRGEHLTVFRGNKRWGRAEREESKRLKGLVQDLLSAKQVDSGLRRLQSTGFIPGLLSGLGTPWQETQNSPSRISTGREFWLDFDEVAVSLHPRQAEDGGRRCADRDIRAASISLNITQILIRATPFDLRMVRDEEDNLRLTATRIVVMDPIDVPAEAANESYWRCLNPLRVRQAWLHGVIIDGDWLAGTITNQTRAEVLPEGQILLQESEIEALGEGNWQVALATPLQDLGVRFENPLDRSPFSLAVATDVRHLQQSLSQRMLWFAALVLMMLISLGVGLNLLLASVKASQEQTRRTENFVAAVTHELRTPIASVRMYGEMLRDGWAKDSKVQDRYLGHILTASERLSSLVERVINKRRLSEAPETPQAGDLAAAVRDAIEEVSSQDLDDLKVHMETDLPQAIFSADGVRMVVINLIENARKYAPTATGDEPLEIRLARSKSRVVLEVSDRGPGIQKSDHKRVLEPFLRLGDETTREAIGTGLGLHLVALYARAMKARLELVERPGGGLTVRLGFRRA